MSQDDWPSLLPKPGESLPRSFRIMSGCVVPFVATCSKIWLTWFNTCRIENREVFLKAIDDHQQNKSYPLVTLCNHHSCMDDPGLWGALFTWSRIWNWQRHRWSAAARDICYTKKLHSVFFSFGKTFPIERGAGIHQRGVNYALELMKCNEFLHFFPQGRVMRDSDQELPDGKITLRDSDFDKPYELKWGLARLILEYLDFPACSNDSNNNTSSNSHVNNESETESQSVVAEKKILLLPFYHLGMTEALPNSPPYIPKVFKKIFISIREAGPIQIDHMYLMKHCFNGDASLPLEEKRRLIMKRLEEELKLIKIKAIKFRDSF